MTLTTVNMVYIGNFTSFDTVEGTEAVSNYIGEVDPGPILAAAGPFDGSNASTIAVTQDDVNYNPAILYEDDDANAGVWTIPPSSFTYNAGAGSVTSIIDHVFDMNATIVYGDGTTVNMTLTMYQTQNGDVFIGDTDLNNVSVQSITFSTLAEDDYLGKPPAYTSTLTFVCFAGDTLIETDHGQRRIDALQPGDMVRTLDDGFQPIRWIGSRKIDAIDMKMDDRMRPIRIRAGALGADLPQTDLMVSRQHRMIVRSRIAARMFDAEEILVPAHRLLDLDGVEVAMDVDQVEYFHMLFDAHQVVIANGAPAESLFLGHEALKSLSAEARAEIMALFPEVAEADFIARAVRPVVAKGRQVDAMLRRHALNGVPVLL